MNLKRLYTVAFLFGVRYGCEGKGLREWVSGCTDNFDNAGVHISFLVFYTPVRQVLLTKETTMPFSDETLERFEKMRKLVDEIMKLFNVPEDRAWSMLSANGSYKAVEVAERLERRTGRAFGSLASTFKNAGGE